MSSPKKFLNPVQVQEAKFQNFVMNDSKLIYKSHKIRNYKILKVYGSRGTQILNGTTKSSKKCQLGEVPVGGRCQLGEVPVGGQGPVGGQKLRTIFFQIL